ncbi:MAG: PTS ascorbate transporter subunit IIC [Solobacterium sp.]|nr:PTS ascorbate transporter subunit IIC [Solobacterium sp.]
MAEKKQVPLRLSEELYSELAKWAEEDFRSVNGQIEFLLTECAKAHKKSGRYIPEQVRNSYKEEN